MCFGIIVFFVVSCSYDTSFGYMERTYSFDALRHKIKPGVYNLTVVNDYDNTFDTASFTLYNDIIIYSTYKIKNNDVIFNVEVWSEYNTPIEFSMFKIVNGTPYEYRVINKEILANTNTPKFNFEICFDNVDNNDYYVSISDYWSTIDFIYFTVNFTTVNEIGINNSTDDMMNETVNISDIVKRNTSGIYNDNDMEGNDTNGVDANLDLKENSTNSNSQQSHKSNGEDFREKNSDFGDLISSVDSISGKDTNLWTY